MTQYPMNMVQTMTSYLYTGIMQKPEGAECKLFEQLLAEYGLTPEYTVNPKELERIGKGQDAKEPQRATREPAANLDFQNEIKQELGADIEFENYPIPGGDNDDDAHHDINNDANNDRGNCEMKKEMENTIDDNSMSDVDDLSGAGNDVDNVDDDNDLDEVQVNSNVPNDHTLHNDTVDHRKSDTDIIDLDDVQDDIHNEPNDNNKDNNEEHRRREEMSKEKEEWSMLCVPKMRPAARTKSSFRGPRIINANKGKTFRTKSDSKIFTTKFIK